MGTVTKPILGSSRGEQGLIIRRALAPCAASEGRDDFLVERQRGLHDRREPGGCAGVADVGYDAADRARR